MKLGSKMMTDQTLATTDQQGQTSTIDQITPCDLFVEIARQKRNRETLALLETFMNAALSIFDDDHKTSTEQRKNCNEERK